jgi:Tyrosine phosphatase family
VRSQALALSPADLAAVDNLGITADYDLRTVAEIAESPDVVPAGATYTNLNVMASADPHGDRLPIQPCQRLSSPDRPRVGPGDRGGR